MGSALLLGARARTNAQSNSYAKWNVSDKAPNIYFSGGQYLIAQITPTGVGLVRSTNVLSGKVYFELSFNLPIIGGARLTAGGVCGGSLSASTGAAYTSSDALECWPREGSCWTNGASVGTMTGGTVGTQTIRIAVDVPNRKVWMTTSGNTSWLLGGDPALGTTPTATLTGTDALYAFAEPYNSGDTVTLVSKPGLMLNGPPSGFTAGF